MNRFDELIIAIPARNKDWADAVVAVADTMYLFKVWFSEYGVEFTARDLLTAARLAEEVRAGRSTGSCADDSPF